MPGPAATADRALSRQVRAVRKALLRWYRQHARELPWRTTRDPYLIWVSEIMLQQTRVATVIPYYERFLERFPTVDRLARAKETSVLREWSGLGYYRRARLLHRGAKQVLREHGGTVPRDSTARHALPGVGAYTAGAIGSIAFGLEEPVVDGNVKRVLARVFGIDAPMERREGNRRAWELADALVKGSEPGELNQSLMELGALVCTPRSPTCTACPIAKQCTARRSDAVDRLPRKMPRKKPREERWLAVAPVEKQKSRVLLVEQQGPRFGGLWSLPMLPQEPGTSPRDVLRAAGISASVRPIQTHFTHVLTHRRLEVDVALALGTRRTDPSPSRWIQLPVRGRLATSALTRKMLDWVGDVLA